MLSFKTYAFQFLELLLLTMNKDEIFKFHLAFSNLIDARCRCIRFRIVIVFVPLGLFADAERSLEESSDGPGLRVLLVRLPLRHNALGEHHRYRLEDSIFFDSD